MGQFPAFEPLLRKDDTLFPSFSLSRACFVALARQVLSAAIAKNGEREIDKPNDKTIKRPES